MKVNSLTFFVRQGQTEKEKWLGDSFKTTIFAGGGIVDQE